MVKLEMRVPQKKKEYICKKMHLDLLSDDEGIVVVIVDKHGKPVGKDCSLVRIMPNGILVRPRNLNPKYGFRVNKMGQILEKMLLKKKK